LIENYNVLNNLNILFRLFSKTSIEISYLGYSFILVCPKSAKSADHRTNRSPEYNSKLIMKTI